MTLVAAVQMASGPRLEPNLDEARRLLREAAAAGAKLAVLPEYFAQFGLPEQERVRSAEKPGSGPVQEFLARTAFETGMWIVGGSLPMKIGGKTEQGGRVRGACLVFDSEGEQVARFDKMHLFDVHIPEKDERYEESGWTEPGDEIVVVGTPFGRLGLAVCYDLRFPELFRAMSVKGVDIVALPAAFTAATGRAHWEILLRARAVENLAYVVAAAQGGFHANGRETFGDSMIVDPWGGILARRRENGSGIVTANIDLERQRQLRRTFPVLDHRKT
ncbi:MAG TPA: carbon-nitrogen hydrolase family protein [Gammaproteobacteria bacterium]